MNKSWFFLVVYLYACSVVNENISDPGTENTITYSGDSLKYIAIPLGGIGTGDVLIGGRGNIKSLEIFNRPAMSGELPYMTFFSIWCQKEGEKAESRILEARLPDDSPGPYGVERRQLAGLPRFQNIQFVCKYPLIHFRLKDEKIPIDIEAEFLNPYVPLDVDNSSLPLVQFNWNLTNNSNEPVRIALAMNMCNPLYNYDDNKRITHEGNINRYYENDVIKGIAFLNGETEDSPLFGNLKMATSYKSSTVQTAWFEGAWWDDATIFWDDFAEDGRVAERKEEVTWQGSDWYGSNNQSIVGNITVQIPLEPGETVKIPFYLSWYVPNRIMEASQAFGNDVVQNARTRNYYATRFRSSGDILNYYLQNEQQLYEYTHRFTERLYNSTIPDYAIDAVSANCAILKSTLLMRTEEGWVHGFEGMGPDSGCCPGNCTHVWNYAQTMASLFPTLEQKVREVSFLHDTHDNGYQCFRTVFPLGDHWFKSVAADGQMGNIVRAYREWKNTGDSEWLKALWPKIKLALEFAWKGSGEVSDKYRWQENAKIPWDPNKEGIMRGRQHNTYDIDFFGPNMMTGSLYLAALRACSEMAAYFGEEDKAREYSLIYENGRREYERLLWNSEYFIQKVEVIDGIQIPDRLKSPPDVNGLVIPKYQFGDGCLSDQLLGQFLAFNAGMGYIVDSLKVQKAMHSVYKYNFIPDFSARHNVQRVFAMNNEGGMVIGTWPNGNRPRIPFVYADEVWTGVEYEAAVNMIWSGLIDEGLEVVKKVRQRYRGFNRNPWGEIESGMYYARAMASWSILFALSGFEYDGIKQFMKFEPRINQDNFSTFWSCGTAWGNYTQYQNAASLDVDFGTLRLKSLELSFGNIESVVLNNKTIEAAYKNNCLIFNETIEIKAGQVLRIN